MIRVAVHLRRKMCRAAAVLALIAAPALAAGAGATQESRAANGGPPVVLKVDAYKHYVDHFNQMEDEFVVNLIPNADAWDWMARNVPAFECPDPELEEIYWYRWWTYRKALKQMPDHIAMTEFIKRNPVSSAV